MSRNINQSLNTAFASAQMEGFQVTPKIEADCRMIVSGELSISEYICQVTEAKGRNDRGAATADGIPSGANKPTVYGRYSIQNE